MSRPPFDPEIHMHGPSATHRMPCPVCWVMKAVLNLDTGIFEPCWECQGEGWRIRRTWRSRLRSRRFVTKS